MNKIKTLYRNMRMWIRKAKYAYRYKKQSCHQISALVDSSVKYHLFITNDNLGGTRQYEKNYIKKEKHVILMRRISYGERPDIIFEITNIDNGRMMYLYPANINQLFSIRYDRITINTMVHVTSIKQLFKSIMEYKAQNVQCYLLYLIHDFHAVCINPNLFANGHYCNLECEKENCRLRMGDTLVNILQWRSMWLSLLEKTDEIRCFSQSSKNILCSIYQSLPSEKISVIPHDVSFLPFTPISKVDTLPLHIGFIGDCNADIKGRAVARQIIKKYGNDIPITLVGSEYRHYGVTGKKVHFMGPYKHEDLQNIIEKERISIAVFPSLCPETFSYLVSELIAMDLPVICFNYGAQAEKVNQYHKGSVCADIGELYSVIEKYREK